MSTINPPTSSRDTTGQTRTQATESERAAAAAMLPMIWGLHISRAIYVTAELSIADLLADGPVSSMPGPSPPTCPRATSPLRRCRR